MLRRYKGSDGIPTTKRFGYPKPVMQHFRGRHAVDDHNNRRHSPILIEETWGTKWWPHRNVGFLLGMTEVNVNLGKGYWGEEKPLPQLEMRKRLAFEMMTNCLNEDGTEGEKDGGERRSKRTRESALPGHRLCTIPHFRSRWLGNKWKKSKPKYQQQFCACGKRTRKLCECDRRVYFCKECYIEHKLQAPTGV